jgi:lysophospholipase L1-like esterase
MAQVGQLKPLKNQTVRQRVKVSVAGSTLRVVLTNAYGTKPLRIAAATVLRARNGQGEGAALPLSFAGAPSIVVPVGAPAFSDPLPLSVAAGAELLLSLYLPDETLPETYHRALAGQDQAAAATVPEAQVSAEGDYTRDAVMAGAQAGARLFVARVDVLAAKRGSTVVVLGTTRTAGEGRWPELLAKRLQAAGRNVSVVNASMVANPLTRPYPGGGDAGLARFDRDVLGVPGITHVILADAANDIGQPGGPAIDASQMPTLQDLTAAYLQLALRARAAGVKVIAATVLPFEGVPFAGFWSPQKEQLRGQLNEWIRSSGAFDAVIDMEAMLRDPAKPTRFREGLHTANNFGPNEAGEQYLVQGLDLKLFR